MKICFIHKGFSESGGIERVISILINELIREYEIHLVIMEKWDRDSFVVSLPENIIGIGWNTDATMREIIFCGGIRRLRNYLKANEIDIAIACGTLYYVLVAVAAKGIKTRSICWEHSNANNRADHKFQMQARYVGARFGDAIVALTKQDQGLYESKYHPKRLRQIYNPVDPRLTRADDYTEQKKKIISVGRFSAQKNYPALVEIANVVLKKHHDWIWDIYGGGSTEIKEWMMKSIAEKGLRGKLNLKGQSDNLYDQYRDYDFLVMTSLYEGFSMALLEALASGLPLVVFDVECGPKEIIEDGVNGYLISGFDQKRMAGCIEGMITDPELLREMKHRTGNNLWSFTMERIIEQWKALFEDLAHMDVCEG